MGLIFWSKIITLEISAYKNITSSITKYLKLSFNIHEIHLALGKFNLGMAQLNLGMAQQLRIDISKKLWAIKLKNEN